MSGCRPDLNPRGQSSERNSRLKAITSANAQRHHSSAPRGSLRILIWNYARRHFSGHLSLAITFWLNFVLLSIVYYGVESVLLDLLRADFVYFVVGTITSLVIISLVVFPWQCIGLLRCMESHYQQYQDPVLLRSIQAVVVLAGAFVVVHVVESAQSMISYDHQLESSTTDAGNAVYALTLSADGRLLHITGTLDHGVTQNMRSVLANEPAVEGVVLASPGGMIYEGRGLALAIMEHKLVTYVFDECSSACATAFLGGRTRHLGPSAKLGFHRYKFDAVHLRQFASFYDLEAEQKKDLALYQHQGVSKQFRQMIFAQPPQKIWFPEHQELIDHGVIHSILPSGTPRPRVNGQSLFRPDESDHTRYWHRRLPDRVSRVQPTPRCRAGALMLR